MGLQKCRADSSGKRYPNGGKPWFALWMGGPTLSKIEDCAVDGLGPSFRRTVYITGEPDSFFSIPAACSVEGRTVKGFITSDDTGSYFCSKALRRMRS